MKLYVMRHGPAEDEAESRVDDDRALTATGRERVRDVARALVEAGEEPSDVVTSPLVRAVQTAEVVALVTKLDDRHGTVRVLRDLSPGGESARLVRRICAEGRKRVMLVGHEPDLSELVATLVGSSFSRGLDKASVVGLHFSAETGRARLRFVLDPKSLTFDPPPSSSSP